MNIHQTKIKVRYAETDQMGVVYHGNYAQYLEIGRLGVAYCFRNFLQRNGANRCDVARRILNLKYKKPALYDDVLTVSTRF